jgi:Zn finger protein HypA/HybF involved in hydrogenase expression
LLKVGKLTLNIMCILDEQPTIDPVRGRWVNVEDEDYTVKCTVCGFFDYDYLTEYAYCPMCGARMDEGGGE